MTWVEKNGFHVTFLGVVAAGIMPKDNVICVFQDFPSTASMLDGIIVGYLFLTATKQGNLCPCIADLKYMIIFTLCMPLMPWIGLLSNWVLVLRPFDARHYFAYREELKASHHHAIRYASNKIIRKIDEARLMVLSPEK